MLVFAFLLVAAISAFTYYTLREEVDRAGKGLQMQAISPLPAPI